MQCKKIGYEVQRLEVVLSPGETIYAERGALVYCSVGVQKVVEMNGNGLGGVIKSKLSGESFLLLRLSNNSSSEQRVLLSSASTVTVANQNIQVPAGILPIKMVGQPVICGRGAYIASTEKVDLGLSISVQGLLSGLGFLQRIRGNGTVFLASKGLPVEVDLRQGEQIEVDEKHVVAMVGINDYQLSATWSLKNVLGGEGVSLINVSGPGKLFLN